MARRAKNKSNAAWLRTAFSSVTVRVTTHSSQEFP